MDDVPIEVRERADELIRLFAIDRSREDLTSLAAACEGFEDALSRAAAVEIARRAVLAQDANDGGEVGAKLG